MTFDRIMKTFGWLVIINLLAYFAINFIIGGDAPSGEVIDGRYYVSSHGKLTEVSRSVFTYSTWHSYVAWGGLLAYLVAGMLWKGRAFWSEYNDK